MINALTHDEVDIHIDADPQMVYDLVADVTRMPSYSPEIVSCEWLDGATGPAVGARFKAVNKIDRGQWSNKPVVTVADPGREFAISRVEPMGGEIVWRYRFEPEDGGTRVRESYEVVRQPTWVVRVVAIRLLNGIRDRREHLRSGMQTTLERLKHAAEQAAAGT